MLLLIVITILSHNWRQFIFENSNFTSSASSLQSVTVARRFLSSEGRIRLTFLWHLPLTDDYFRLSKQQMKLEEFVVLNVVITSMVSRLW